MPIVPVVIGEVGTTIPGVGGVDACVLINATGCTTGTPTTPTTPDHPDHAR